MEDTRRDSAEDPGAAAARPLPRPNPTILRNACTGRILAKYTTRWELVSGHHTEAQEIEGSAAASTSMPRAPWALVAHCGYRVPCRARCLARSSYCIPFSCPAEDNAPAVCAILIGGGDGGGGGGAGEERVARRVGRMEVEELGKEEGAVDGRRDELGAARR